jgi:hypothetical protein
LNTTVGDSPRGPLKQTGESPLKTRNKPKLSTPRLSVQGMAHAVVAPTARQGGPLKVPLERAPPRSRAHASLGRAPPGSSGCAYLEPAPPRSRVRSAHLYSNSPTISSATPAGTWKPCFLSRLACSSPTTGTLGAKQYSALSTPLLDVRPIGRNQDKTLCL